MRPVGHPRKVVEEIEEPGSLRATLIFSCMAVAIGVLLFVGMVALAAIVVKELW